MWLTDFLFQLPWFAMELFLFRGASCPECGAWMKCEVKGDEGKFYGAIRVRGRGSKKRIVWSLVPLIHRRTKACSGRAISMSLMQDLSLPVARARR
jgi:hypothetical protein